MCQVYYLIKEEALTYIFDDINNNSFVSGRSFAGCLRHEAPQLVQVESRFVLLIPLQVEMTDTTLSEVARVTRIKRISDQKGVLTISQS